MNLISEFSKMEEIIIWGTRQEVLQLDAYNP